MYNTSFGKAPRVGLHFSGSVPTAVHTRDIAMEVFLMAKYCRALLATRPNIAFMVSRLAEDSFGIEDFFSGRVDFEATDSVGSSKGQDTPPPPHEVFSSQDGNLQAMWLKRETVAIKVLDSKLG